MKRLIITLALLATVGFAHADNSLSGTVNNRSNTASTAGATNAGNNQGITQTFAAGEKDTSVKTNPSVIVPNLYGSFSQASCMVSAGGGFSGGLIGLSLAGPVEDQACTDRLNSTLLMQMSNNVRPINPDMADRLVRAAANNMCNVNDKSYAVMHDAGLCDTIDFEGYKQQRATPVAQQDRPPRVARGQLVGYYPSTGN